ncbi:DUF99 family protein [Acidianus sp. HS-5]|uniref:endonuclease dU n=1 Tax=Acidianus sp. HS-5 TaxID=2886040 RepID=UPI001F2CCE63|nr:DUF99 family protein [Acidianus sp. HS-5]BDC19263.1 hypothetical protein HS5_21530 [Acidianus sp. HS-5]
MLVSGIDDGYFPLTYKGKHGKCPLVSVTFDGFELTDIDVSLITVDGDDATNAYKNLRKGDIIILDSIIVGGFNYIIPDNNYIIYYANKPDIESILHAARKHYNDQRVNIIQEFLSDMIALSTKRGTVYVNTDLDLKMVKGIIEYYQVFSKYPEPIKYAHIIGKAIGQSQLVSD